MEAKYGSLKMLIPKRGYRFLQKRGNTNMLLGYYFNPVLRVFNYVSRKNLQTELYYLWFILYINCAIDKGKDISLVSTPESLNGDSYLSRQFYVLVYAHKILVLLVYGFTNLTYPKYKYGCP
jgi:hypothetical protein